MRRSSAGVDANEGQNREGGPERSEFDEPKTTVNIEMCDVSYVLQIPRLHEMTFLIFAR